MTVVLQLLARLVAYYEPLRIGPPTNTAGVHYWASLARREWTQTLAGDAMTPQHDK